MAKEAITFEIKYDKFDSRDDLPEKERELLARAKGAMQNAHSPYSDFMVGAAVELKDGTVVIGSNQENASYGLTICAERSALVTVGSMGRKKDVIGIAVVGTGRKFNTTQPVTPCGACRQFLKEFEDLSGNPLTILTAGAEGQIYRFKGIDKLLPFGFGPKDLNLA